jgi:hypothetical protein
MRNLPEWLAYLTLHLDPATLVVRGFGAQTALEMERGVSPALCRQTIKARIFGVVLAFLWMFTDRPPEAVAFGKTSKPHFLPVNNLLRRYISCPDFEIRWIMILKTFEFQNQEDTSNPLISSVVLIPKFALGLISG